MLKFDTFQFDSKSGRLTKDGSDTPIFLRHKLIQLLNYLLNNQDRVVSKSELLGALWEHGKYREQSLSQSILELRKALGDSASSPKYIRTIPNQGYRWVGPKIESVQDPQTSSKILTQLKYLTRPAFLATLLIIFTVVFALFSRQETSDSTNLADINLKVLVLPFENKTHTSAMNWVEYGLSDMMANDLMLIQGLEVISPAELGILLGRNYLNKHAGAQQLALFLKENRIDVAIKSSIKLEKEQQVLLYQIITAEGKPEAGAIIRQDLAVSMPDIVSELYTKLKPKSDKVKLPLYDYVPSAMHDYARGIQALQSEGAVLAQHYFGASIQIDSNHVWSAAYQGVCQFHLGDWLGSERIFKQILDQNTETSLQSFVYYWLALLNYRRGFLEVSSTLLSYSLDNLNTQSSSLLTNMIQQLNARILLLRPDLSSLQEYEQLKALQPSSLMPSYTSHEVPLFPANNISAQQELENSLRHLTIKGDKPAQFLLLLMLAQQEDISSTERDIYFKRAIKIIEQLNQPYDLAIAFTLRARYAIEQRNSEANIYLTKAHAISNKLGAEKLLEVIRFYTIFVRINEYLLQGKVEGIAKAEELLASIASNELNTEQLYMMALGNSWLNDLIAREVEN